MAWTSPKTYASGDVLTAADMNTYQRDNIDYLNDAAGDPPMARITDDSVGVTYASGSRIGALDAMSETYDSGGVHSTGSNPDRMTVPSGQGGMWQAEAWVQTASYSSGLAELQIVIYNGSAVQLDRDRWLYDQTQQAMLHCSTGPYAASAGDYFYAPITKSGGVEVSAAWFAAWKISNVEN